MTAIITVCRVCGQEFEPDHAAIMAGVWQRCPACRPTQPETATHCEECGRPLRAGNRTLCYTCLTGGVPL